MYIFKDAELIELEQDYAKLLDNLGLRNAPNRFKKSFDAFRAMSKEMQEAGTETVPDEWSQAFRHAVYDLTELLSIYKSVQGYPDKELLKDKFRIMNGGVSSPAEETSANNAARNVQFELTLYSEFSEAGLKCYLREPRPDIEILNVGRSYAIECKRLFSNEDSQIGKNISAARDQLDDVLQKNPHKTGVIAIDITRRLTRGTDYLLAKNEEVAKLRLSHDMDSFRQQYARYWTATKIKNKRITAILLHASMYTYIEDRGQAAHGAYSIIQDIHPEPYSKLLFRQAFEDVYSPLANHKAAKGRPNIIL